MPSKKRGSDNSTRSSRPSSSKSKLEDQSEENSRDTTSTALVDDFGNPPKEYPPNLRMLCRHTDTFYYEAKILKVDYFEGKPLYTIHYNGWNSRYDEIITHEQAIEKFLELTAENRQKTKNEIIAAKQRVRIRPSVKGRRDRTSTSTIKKLRSETPMKADGLGGGSEFSTSIDNEMEEGQSEPEGKEDNDEAMAIPSWPGVEPLKYIEIKLPVVLQDVIAKDAEIMGSNTKLIKLPGAFTISRIINDWVDQVRTERRNPYGDHFRRHQKSLGDSEALIKLMATILSRKLLFKFEIPQFLDITNKKRRELGYADLTFDQYRQWSSKGTGNVEASTATPKSDTAGTNKNEEPIPMRETRSKKHSMPEKKTPKKELISGYLKDEEIPYHTTYGYIHLIRFLSKFPEYANHDDMEPFLFNHYAPTVIDLMDYLANNIDTYYKQEGDYETASKTYINKAAPYLT